MSTTPVFAEAPTPSSPVRREIAFVDTSVNDWQTLVDGIRLGIEVVLLDGSNDGLAQMVEWAATHSGYDAIHALSHGATGQLQLGTATLDAAALTARAAGLSALGAALKEDGDLLLYGCNVAGRMGRRRTMWPGPSRSVGTGCWKCIPVHWTRPKLSFRPLAGY